VRASAFEIPTDLLKADAVDVQQADITR